MALTRPRYSQIPDSDYKNSCRIVTTTDVTLTGSAPLIYDGVTLVQYDRVLVAGQTDKTQNGIYSVSTLGSGSNGTWVRSKDANANDRLTAGMNTFVEEGTYTGQFWHLLTPGPIVLGVTELVFGQITGNAAGTSSQVQYNLNGSIAGAANLRYDSATGNVLIGGGTASTSNVTGALTVNGGIGVTGNIWASSNIYSAGSRVLTTYDLETVTFLANYISKDPANVYVPVVGTGTIYGTHNFGNLEAISTYGDYNTVAQSGYYSVNDASGAPGFVVYVGFTGISDFNRAVYNINYTQNSGHTITIDLYNYDTDAWDAFAQYSGSGSWQTFALSVIDPDPYIDITGNVTTRIYHVSAGNTSHRTWIDYIALEKSITGGSGPRGPVGATGPSGTYSGGYISGAIITGGNIVSNSGNVSISTTTGAIVLTGQGGAGIGGNVNVGGNVSADKFYTTNGLFWAANGLAFSSGLEVSEINTANTVLSNISTQVTSIRFDRDTGFNVTELNPGNIKVSLGSSFKTWHVPGQADLVAAAEDEVTFFGNGIDITTNPTFPKSITFIANNSVLEANIGAYQLYANANAAAQAVLIDTINSNVSAANAAIQSLSANIGTLVGDASEALDTLLELGNALGNSSSFSSTVVNWLSNISANVAAANVAITTLDANVGTLFLGNASTNANLGAYQLYANANIGTLFLGNASTNANLGAFQLYANANIGSIYNQLNILDANVGAFELYANANIGSIYNQLNTLDANVGAYQLYANANAVSIQTQINSITTSSNANISAFLTTYTGNISAGNIDVTGNISGVNYILANNYVYSANGVSILSAHDANIGTLHLGNISTQANLGAYQTYTNVSIATLDGNIGTLFLGNASTNANLGAYQTYTNVSIATLDANVGTLFLGNASTNANLGAYQLYANANIGSIYNQLNTLDANVGAFELYANANIGTLFLGNASTNANLGAFQTYANANIGTLFLGNASTNANLGAYQTWANIQFSDTFLEIDDLYLYVDANAATQAVAINALSANINAFQSYANTKIGTNTNSNLVVASTTDSVSPITGAVVVAGGMGIGGNLYVAGNIYASNLTAISISTLSVQDPLLYLTADNLFPYNYDIGFFSHYDKESGNEKHTGLARDYTTDIWGFFSNASTSPGATVNWSETDLIYDTVRVGDLIVSNTTPSTSTTTGALRVAGGAGVVGALYITNTGDVSANIGALHLGNIRVNANLGAYQLYANNSISTLIQGNTSTQANLGAFQTYANANIGTLFVSNASTQANLGAYQTYANASFATLDANVGTLYLGNVSTQANLGSLYNANISTQANIGSIRTQLDTLDANVGSYQAYANVYLGVSTTFVVTNSGSSEYVINGENNPALYLVRGQRYNFSVDAAGHPFWIKTAASIGSGDQYNVGVTNNGEDAGVVVFEVPLTAPDVLYYISQFDIAMTNELRVVNFATLDVNIGTLFLGNVSTQANLGAFQTYANATFTTLDANIGTLFLGNASIDANVGTLFLGNASINANLGEFQTYANATFTTYSNANVTAYLPTHTGNISAGNIDVTGNISAGNIDVTGKAAADTVYTTNGIYWTGNGNPYATGGGGGITYTASTTPPVGPAIGDQWYDTAEGILYEYIDDGDTDQWVDIVSPTFSGASPVAFNSNITVGGNILITDGIYWVSNGEPYASGGGGSFSGEDTVLRANVGAFQIYANTQFTSYSNTNVIAYLTRGANIGSGSTTTNLVAAATTTSTSTTTGALVVRGGAGIAGAAYVGGDMRITSGTSTIDKVSGALVVTGGVGVSGSINVNGGSTTAGWTVGGLLQTTSSTPSTSTTTGALYVAGGTGIVGNLHVGGNVIIASATNSNVVVVSTTTSTSSTTGALVVRGGVGVAGNAYISGNVILGSSTTSNVVVAATTTSTSTTTGALVVAGGVGIAGVVMVGGNLVASATTTTTNTTTGALVVRGGAGIAGVAMVGGNIVAAATTASTNTTTGALVVAGGVGIGGALNVASSGSFGGLIQTTATTAATSTATGALYVAGGVGIAGNLHAGGNVILGSSTTTSNVVITGTRTSTTTTTGALVVQGGAGIVGNVYTDRVYTTTGIFWSANNAIFAPPSTNTFTSNLVAASGQASSSTTTGALVVQGGAGITGAVYTGGGLTVTNGGMDINGDVFIDGGFLQVLSGYNSTNTGEGALTIQNSGGLGVTGNIHANKLYTVNGLYWSGNGQPFTVEAANTYGSNLVAASGTASISTTTGAIVVAGTGGLGVGGDLNATAGSTVNGWTVGGLLWAACTTPATSSTSGGGLLVSGGARFSGNIYANGNVFLGNGVNSNLVANATTTSTSTTTGALVVRGGAGVAGNLYVGSEFVIPGGGKITSGGIANFLEKANVVVSAPAATINVDLSVASVMYWTSNSTTNMTANIRGDETTPLNTVLSVGQSVTTALFIPNGVSNYYINSLKIDNTTVTPAYSGNSSPTLGNPDSIDIYSFTILKTADATFKVFATQSQFQHPG